MEPTVKQFNDAINLIDTVRLILVMCRDVYVSITSGQKPARKKGGKKNATSNP